MYTKDLKSILEKNGCEAKLVFLNACHSKQVADIFYEAGAKSVIAVQ